MPRSRRKQPLTRRATVFACEEADVCASATSEREGECGWFSLLSRSSLVRRLCTMPKTSAHLLSRKESERRRAGRSPGERERVGGCVRACVRMRRKVTYEIKSFAALNDGQTKRIGPRARGRATTRSISVRACARSPSLHFAIIALRSETRPRRSRNSPRQY